MIQKSVHTSPIVRRQQTESEVKGILFFIATSHRLSCCHSKELFVMVGFQAKGSLIPFDTIKRNFQSHYECANEIPGILRHLSNRLKQSV